jgi:acetyltransferase-like isoleucine patch superfamily enzyme
MPEEFSTRGGKSSFFCRAFVAPLYRVFKGRGIRGLLRRIALRFEGGAMYSLTVRDLYRKFHGIEVGLYTIGPCEAGPDGLDPGTVIGRYSSIYYTVRTICRDELAKASEPGELFFKSALGNRPKTGDAAARLIIGNDVFIGHNAVILPSTGEIGDGAFIGAGAIVQKPVPPYAVVMGNPARVVRYRFPEAVIKRVLESKWWMKSIDELSGEMEEFQKPLDEEPAPAKPVTAPSDSKSTAAA